MRLIGDKRGEKVEEFASALRLLGAEETSAAQNGNSKEKSKVIPAAFIGHGIDRDIGVEERSDEGPWEDKPVPHAP